MKSSSDKIEVFVPVNFLDVILGQTANSSQYKSAIESEDFEADKTGGT